MLTLYRSRQYNGRRLIHPKCENITPRRTWIVPAQTGKRYLCEKCGAEVIVTRGGNATLYCKHDGQKVELKLKS
jgi:hypothetical protein